MIDFSSDGAVAVSAYLTDRALCEFNEAQSLPFAIVATFLGGTATSMLLALAGCAAATWDQRLAAAGAWTKWGIWQWLLGLAHVPNRDRRIGKERHFAASVRHLPAHVVW